MNALLQFVEVEVEVGRDEENNPDEDTRQSDHVETGQRILSRQVASARSQILRDKDTRTRCADHQHDQDQEVELHDRSHGSHRLFRIVFEHEHIDVQKQHPEKGLDKDRTGQGGYPHAFFDAGFVEGQ